MRHAELFFPILEEESKQAILEVSGLLRIFKDLSIDDDSRLLDLSCGIGRHSKILSKKFKVVGYDPSSYYVNFAKKDAESEMTNSHKGLSFYTGEPGKPDLELFGKEDKFRIIISMFQSIGYISRAYDLAMFKNLRKISSNNCLLVLETENKDWRLRNFEKNKIYEYDSIRIVEKWRFDVKDDIFRNRMKIYTRGKDNRFQDLVLDLPTYMILYTLEELNEITKKAGWKFVRSYHSVRSRKPATTHSQMPLSIYKKISKK